MIAWKLCRNFQAPVYLGSKSDAKNFVRAGDVYALSPVEVPSGKRELIRFLNRVAAESVEAVTE